MSDCDSLGQNTGVGSLSLFQGIFPTQGSNLCLLVLQADSLPAEPQVKPKNTGLGSLSLLQQISPTRELNWGLLHCRQILYQLSYQESPPKTDMEALNVARFQVGHSRNWEHGGYSGDLSCLRSNHLWSCDRETQTQTQVSVVKSTFIQNYTIQENIPRYVNGLHSQFNRWRMDSIPRSRVLLAGKFQRDDITSGRNSG